MRKLIMMQIEDLQSNIKALERTIRARHRANELSQRLAIIPAVGGGITGTAIVATVVDASAFKSGRQQPGSVLFPSRSGDHHQGHAVKSPAIKGRTDDRNECCKLESY